jgi:hypothetical protein
MNPGSKPPNVKKDACKCEMTQQMVSLLGPESLVLNDEGREMRWYPSSGGNSRLVNCKGT